MLLKFFSNSKSTAYLRELAEEFGESTNSIRHELNNLSSAGFLVSKEEGRTILYSANLKHPLYNEVRNLVHKYLGIDKIIDHVLSRIGDLRLAFIVGDYARGQDSGIIELLLVGDINKRYLDRITQKAETLLHRKIKCVVVSEVSYQAEKTGLKRGIQVWG